MKAGSSIAGVTGPSTTRHHAAASATFTRFVRTASQKELAGLLPLIGRERAAADIQGREPLAHGLVTHLVHEAGVELLQFVLVELRRRPGDVGEVDEGGEFVHGRHRPHGLGRADEHRKGRHRLRLQPRLA
jgi:hypothetical protein